MELAGPFHHAVEDRDRLLSRPVGHHALWVGLVRVPTFDSFGREVLEADVGEMREDVVAEDRVVIAERRRLSLAVSLDVAEVLGAGVRDRRSRADQPGQRAGGGPGERSAEPGLGDAPGPIARGRTTTSCPSRAERLLDLAAVRQAVLRSPDRAALALVARDVSGDRLAHRLRQGMSRRNSPPWEHGFRDLFGTASLVVEPARRPEIADL